MRWEEAKNFFEENGYWHGVNHPIVIARKYRKYLLETRARKCSICNNIEWLGQPIPLTMDHIDGDSENWLQNNLRLICGNCDMQLPTYKAKNRGHGRSYRKHRYSAGKTF